MEPAVGTAPTSAAYETAALLFELYGRGAGEGIRPLDHLITNKGLRHATPAKLQGRESNPQRLSTTD